MRVFSILLMVLGLMGVAVVGICGGNEEVKQETIAQERPTKKLVPPAASIDKVVIGVLDFETGGPYVGLLEQQKEALMEELRRNTRVEVVDIPESCSLRDLKKNGYEQAEKYRTDYQLDMILHNYQTGSVGLRRHHFSLIDFYSKKVKEASMQIDRMPIELRFRGISRKLLLSQDLDRVLTAKKKASEIKEAAVPREVKETPIEIDDLIQEGPKLIAGGQYKRVLELIEALLPAKRRGHIQIKTLRCFANLKGWVSKRDPVCKTNWWALRTELIRVGDNEATPMLVIFLKDEDPWLRLYAAELLSHIGDKRALKDLREVGENDENSKVRKYAKRAYEQISGEKF